MLCVNRISHIIIKYTFLNSFWIVSIDFPVIVAVEPRNCGIMNRSKCGGGGTLPKPGKPKLNKIYIDKVRKMHDHEDRICTILHHLCHVW